MKALLTVEDVKSFIHECMVKTDIDENLTRKQVMNKYGFTQPTYEHYIEMGMPWFGKSTRKKFRQHEIEAWFIKNGLSHYVSNQ